MGQAKAGEDWDDAGDGGHRLDSMDRGDEGSPDFGRRSWGRGLVLAMLLGLSGVSIGYGAPGALDSTFGLGGITITFGPSDRANALIQQSDGNLVVAGVSGPVTGGSSDVLLVRYLADGQLDATFEVGGAVTTDFGAGEGATALALQPDGKLVVAGAAGISQSQNTILERYHPHGRLDESFGGGVRSASISAGSVIFRTSAPRACSDMIGIRSADGQSPTRDEWPRPSGETLAGGVRPEVAHFLVILMALADCTPLGRCLLTLDSIVSGMKLALG